ncbi:hypothetical protein V6Z12_D06G108100 [Gossypium hirsutum]
MVASPCFTDRVFKSREELMQWVQNTTFSLGYIIVTRRSKAKENSVVSYVRLICDRGGEYKFKESSKKVICDQHNHPPTQHIEGHAYARRLKENEKNLLGHAYARRKNITPHDILSTLKEQDENNISTLKTIYNARQKLRSSQNVGKTPIQFSVNNISNELENLFFIHPRSLNIWRVFSHVLIVDATYKMNKYDLSFVQIVGVTSTNKTFSVAFAFIINEKVENYNWALTCLKLTLEECMYPCVIVTDRELALMNACQQVFPDATRLLCRWHITENIKKHYRQSIKSQHEWDSFCTMWTVLVESPTWILYTENYRKLQSMLSEYLSVLKYLDQVWLSKYKEMFMLVWIDRHLNFGERTTNRVESQHAKLKKYLCARNSSLDKFVGCIDQIMKSQLTSIYESFEKSRIILKHIHNLPCFRLLRGFVALEALDILEGELQRSSRHQLDYSNSGCKLRHSCGLPCACILSRKLYLSPSTSVENDDICCDGELEMFKENFTKQSKARKKSLLRKLRDIFQSSKTLIKEPTIQKNTRVLIANRFGVILNYLTKRGDITSFPLWRGPEHFQCHHAITITHVYDNHNVMVQLEGDYPMPTISAYWIRHRAPSIAGWQTMYMSRLEFYRQLKPCNIKTPVITIEDYC